MAYYEPPGLWRPLESTGELYDRLEQIAHRDRQARQRQQEESEQERKHRRAAESFEQFLLDYFS